MADIIDRAQDTPLPMHRAEPKLMCTKCGEKFTNPEHVEDGVCNDCYFKKEDA